MSALFRASAITASSWIPKTEVIRRRVSNFNLGFLGLPRDPFGSVMISNVGGMGINVAWAPLVPYSRVPLLMTLGAITDKAVVENGEVKVRPILPIGVMFDHRLIDGVHAAQMSAEFKKCFAEPAEYFGK